MPTIRQLPLATSVNPTDELPVSQNGQTKSLQVGLLLDTTQPAIILAPAKLLGRISPTAGGPEPVDVGVGLAVQGTALAATGADHGQFAAAAGLSSGDEVVLNSGGQPRRMAATALRGLFSAGPGVTLQNGVISAPGGSGGGTGTEGPPGPAGPPGPTGPQGPQGDAGSGTVPTDNAQLTNSRGYITLPEARTAAAGVISVSGAPNAGGALGTYLDITNPGVPVPTDATFGTRVTYLNPNTGQAVTDHGHAVQAVWQQAPGQIGGRMSGSWTVAAGPRNATATWGLVGAAITPVNRGDDTGWTVQRATLPRTSVALQLVPETDTFTQGGTAQNVTAALVIAQSPFPRPDGAFARSHSGILIEPNAISGGVGRALTVTGDVTGPGNGTTQSIHTPYALLTAGGGWLHGFDLSGATVFDGVALRMAPGQRLGWGAAHVGADAAGNVLLDPAPGMAVRVGIHPVWHAGNLQRGTTPGTIAAGDDARIVGAAPLNLLATGTQVARSLAVRAADTLNARDFGAMGNGATPDGAALTQCIATAGTLGRDVYIPAGTYLIRANGVPVSLFSGVAVRGAGMGRTVLLVDDTGAGSQDAISNLAGQTGDFSVSDLTIRGMADTVPTTGLQPFLIQNAGHVTIRNVEVRHSRNFGITVLRCRSATVTGCRIHRNVADGIHVSDTPDAVITGNFIEGVNDDGIAAHCSDSRPSPARSGVLIAHNRLVESQGIACLGAKALTITGNVMSRMMGYGVYVYASPFFGGGDTPMFAVKISGNHIADVFRRVEATPRNQEQGYIQLVLGARQPGGGPAAPGDFAPGSGQAVPLLGTGHGAFYVQDTHLPGTASPGARWIDVSGNTLVRTLPAVGAWSEWGYGTALWVGDQSASGVHAGAVPESNLATDGIVVSGTLRNSQIEGNTVETTAARAIHLGAAAAIGHGDFDGLVISGNSLRDFTGAAIHLAGAVLTSHQMRVSGNAINGDPRLAHPNRGVDGTWASAAGPSALSGRLSGAAFEGNHLRNVAALFQQDPGALCLVRRNTVFADSPFAGFDVRNKGVGTAPASGAAYEAVHEDSDPRSTTYGRVLTQPSSPVWDRANLTFGAGLAHNAVSGELTAAADPSRAPLNSPALTGTPTAPTPALNTSTTQLATTAFVLAQDALKTTRAANLADVASRGLSRMNINQGSVALTSGASVATNCASGNAFTLTLGVNAALANPAGLAAGASYCWTVAQDATGGRTLSFGTAFKFPGGVVPALSTAANATDVLTAVSNGTVLFAVLSKGFA